MCLNCLFPFLSAMVLGLLVGSGVAFRKWKPSAAADAENGDESPVPDCCLGNPGKR